MEKNFIYITEDMIYDSQTIRRNEVGIIEEEKGDSVMVSFVNQNNCVKVNKRIIKYFNPLETGDNYDFKICNRCNRLLKTEMFDKNQNRY